MKHSLPILLLASILLVACSTPAASTVPIAPSAPQVIINSPASGAQQPTGADVVIQSTSTDAQGVLRVELLVDGQSVRSDAIPSGKSQPQFQVVQTWKATTPGTHIILVRATNEKGVNGEASLTLTVIDAPKPTTASSSASSAAPATAKPSSASSSVAPTSPPAATPTTAPPTAKPAPTSASTQYTVIFTEAQVNAMLNSAMGATQQNFVSTASISLQNGQISTNTTFKGPGGTTVNGQLVIAVSASNCDLRVTIVQATIGQLNMTEAQKAALSQSLEKAIESQLAQVHDYKCVDSVTIANGVMTIKYH